MVTQNPDFWLFLENKNQKRTHFHMASIIEWTGSHLQNPGPPASSLPRSGYLPAPGEARGLAQPASLVQRAQTCQL